MFRHFILWREKDSNEDFFAWQSDNAGHETLEMAVNEMRDHRGKGRITKLLLAREV